MSTVSTDATGHGLIDTDFRRSLLHSIALFRDVDPDAMGDLLTRCSRIDIRKGEMLLSPTRPNRCVYIVLSGMLEVRLGSLDAPRTRHKVGRGHRGHDGCGSGDLRFDSRLRPPGPAGPAGPIARIVPAMRSNPPTEVCIH